MERDPSFKQVIPYLVLRDGARFFLMQRTTGGGDARLHGRYSIGVGGHLNPGDGGLLGGLGASGARSSSRTSCPEFQLVALLNDDTTEVGAVHLGAVYVADAAGRPVAIRETDKLTGSFVDGSRGRGGRRPARDVEPARLRPSRRGRTIGGASRPKAGPIIATPGQRHADTAIPADMSDPASSVED